MLEKISVSKPYTVIVAVMIVIILGAVSLAGIRSDLLPDIDYPYAVITVEYGEAAPSDVETVVTNPIEKALSTVGKISNIKSVSTEGKSIVTVEFTRDADMDTAVSEIREALEPLSDDWGEGVSSPVIRKINPDSMPVIVASIDVEGQDAASISAFVNGNLIGYLEGIDGVADYTVRGNVNERVQITINAEKLAAVNKTISDAIGGDFEKARAALLSASNELSTSADSGLLSQTSSIDAQIRSLNSQLASLISSSGGDTSTITSLKNEISALKTQRDNLQSLMEEEAGSVDDDVTEDRQDQITSLESQIAYKEAALENAQSNASGSNSAQIANIQQQISALESQRETLTSRMSASETNAAESTSTITDQLSALDAQEKEAREKADLETLITTRMVSTMLNSQNFSSSAGYLSLGNREYNVRVGDEITSVDELNDLVLFHFDIEGVEDVLLSQVADVAVVNDSSEVYSVVDGHDAVIVSFLKQSDFSTVETADNIKDVFKKIQKDYSQVSITVLSDQSTYIDRVSGAVSENLIIGAVLATLILLLFLRDLRPTLVVALSIPVSLLFAVTLMYFTGVTLNIFSLSGLALGVGMLVDNSIVVMENIYRCRAAGLSRRDAAIEGTRQVAAAIIASTLTTMCVFLPIVFTQGMTRRLFADIGLTISFALLASLIIAFTLIPAMSSGILRRMDKKKKHAFESAANTYEGLLQWTLQHRGFVIIFALMLLVFSTIFALTNGTSFLPEADSNEMTLVVSAKGEGTDRQLWTETDEVIGLIREMDGVKSVGAYADEGGSIFRTDVSEGNSTVVYVLLENNHKKSCSEMADQIDRETGNLDCLVDITAGSYDMSSLYDSGLKVTVSGPDLTTLSSITADMGDLLLSVEGTKNVKSSVDTASPVLKISVDKAAAMKYGLTVSEVYDFISDSISSSSNATTLSGSDTDVIVVDGSAEELQPADIQNIRIPVTDDDGLTSEVVIGSIASITEETGAPVIYHNNRARYMTASADVVNGYNVGLISKETAELVSGYSLPSGYRVSFEGESTVISDSIGDMALILLLALALMYLILVAQFQSLLIPLAILAGVPMSYAGGLIALLIAGKDISVIAVVGFLLLSGIVVNNGIVLVDYTGRLRRGGMSLSDAVVEGGKTRLRPVLMTALTTVLALLTLTFGLGTGAEVVQPMAIVVFGGMIYALAITLFVVPALYDLLLRRKGDAPVTVDDDEDDEIVRPSEGPAEPGRIALFFSDLKESAKDKVQKAKEEKQKEKERRKAEREEEDEIVTPAEPAPEEPPRRDYSDYEHILGEEEEPEPAGEKDAEGAHHVLSSGFVLRLRKHEEASAERDREKEEKQARKREEKKEQKEEKEQGFRLFRRQNAEEGQNSLRNKLKSFFEEDEDIDDGAEDEDYYGLRERRSREYIDEKTREEVLRIPKEDSFSAESGNRRQEEQPEREK